MPTIRDIIIDGLTKIGQKNNLSSLELEGFVNKCEKIFINEVEHYNKVKRRSIERSPVAEKIYQRIQEKKKEKINLSLFSPLELAVMSAACQVHGVTIGDVGSSSRKRDVVDCRYQIHAVLVLYLNMTQQGAGKLFNQDHSTVINALHKHSNLLETDKVYLNKFVNLLNQLKESHPEFFGGIEPTKAIRRYSTNQYIKFKQITFEKVRLDRRSKGAKIVLESELILKSQND